MTLPPLSLPIGFELVAALAAFFAAFQEGSRARCPAAGSSGTSALAGVLAVAFLFLLRPGVGGEAVYAFTLPVGLILARYLPPETGPRRINSFEFPVAPKTVPADLPYPVALTNVRFMLTAHMVALYLLHTPTLMLQFVATFLVARDLKWGIAYSLHIPRRFQFFVYVAFLLLSALGPDVSFVLRYHRTYDYYWFEFSEGVLMQLADSGIAEPHHYAIFRKQFIVELPKSVRNPFRWRNYDSLYRSNEYYSECFIDMFGRGAGKGRGSV